MAEEVAFIIKIEGQDRAINSLKDLKKAKKDATDAFLKGDKDAAKALADLTDKTEDLADASRSLKGSGVESAASSFGLLGDGLKNLDLDKVKTGFKGLGSAMKAIPLLLIVEGITYLITNFDELSKGSGILATILRAVGDVVSWLIDGFTDLIGVTSDATRAIEKQGEAIKKSSESATEKLTAQTAAYDRQIAVAKASGKNTVALEKAKQEAIIQTNYILAKQIEAFVRAGGVLDEEKRKQLAGNLAAIAAAKTQEKVIDITDYKDRLEKKKTLDAEFRQYQKDLDLQNEAIKQKDLKLLQDQLINKKVEDKEVELQQLQGLDETYRQQDLENLKAWNEKKRQEDEKNIDLVKSGIQSTKDLTDIFFAFKSAKLTKGTKEEEENAKKQFNINKGIQLGLAIIDGYKSISASLAQSPVAIGPVPNPAGIASLAFAAISTASIIAKIASAKFQSNGGGGATTNAGIASPSIPNSSVPNVTPPPPQPTTLLDANGQPINSNKPQTIRVINVESDTTRVQEDVKRVKNQATI